MNKSHPYLVIELGSNNCQAIFYEEHKEDTLPTKYSKTSTTLIYSFEKDKKTCSVDFPSHDNLQVLESKGLSKNKITYYVVSDWFEKLLTNNVNLNEVISVRDKTFTFQELALDYFKILLNSSKGVNRFIQQHWKVIVVSPFSGQVEGTKLSQLMRSILSAFYFVDHKSVTVVSKIQAICSYLRTKKLAGIVTSSEEDNLIISYFGEKRLTIANVLCDSASTNVIQVNNWEGLGYNFLKPLLQSKLRDFNDYSDVEKGIWLNHWKREINQAIKHFSNISVRMDIKREELEEYCSLLIENVIEILKCYFNQASNASKIILVGGFSHLSLLNEAIELEFGRYNTNLLPFNSVVIGAYHYVKNQYYNLKTNEKEVVQKINKANQKVIKLLSNNNNGRFIKEVNTQPVLDEKTIFDKVQLKKFELNDQAQTFFKEKIENLVKENFNLTLTIENIKKTNNLQQEELKNKLKEKYKNKLTKVLNQLDEKNNEINDVRRYYEEKHNNSLTEALSQQKALENKLKEKFESKLNKVSNQLEEKKKEIENVRKEYENELNEKNKLYSNLQQSLLEANKNIEKLKLELEEKRLLEIKQKDFVSKEYNGTLKKEELLHKKEEAVFVEELEIEKDENIDSFVSKEWKRFKEMANEISKLLTQVEDKKMMVYQLLHYSFLALQDKNQKFFDQFVDNEEVRKRIKQLLSSIKKFARDLENRFNKKIELDSFDVKLTKGEIDWDKFDYSNKEKESCDIFLIIFPSIEHTIKAVLGGYKHKNIENEVNVNDGHKQEDKIENKIEQVNIEQFIAKEERSLFSRAKKAVKLLDEKNVNRKLTLMIIFGGFKVDIKDKYLENIQKECGSNKISEEVSKIFDKIQNFKLKLNNDYKAKLDLTGFKVYSKVDSYKFNWDDFRYLDDDQDIKNCNTLVPIIPKIIVSEDTTIKALLVGLVE
ncbi:hypothetical protein ABK040_011952 [Willaertia magna]